jgi:hypothetical protein
MLHRNTNHLPYKTYSLKAAKKMSAIPISDYVKVLVLLLLYIGCMISWIGKYSGYNMFSGSSKTTHLSPDYSFCTKLKDCSSCAISYDDCATYLSKTFDEAMGKCSGYVNKLKSCEQQGYRSCNVEYDNTRSCINSIVDTKLKSWEHYQDVPQ